MDPVTQVVPAHNLEPPPESTSSQEKLEWTCRKLGLPQPVYNLYDYRPKKGPVTYDCTVKVSVKYSRFMLWRDKLKCEQCKGWYCVGGQHVQRVVVPGLVAVGAAGARGGGGEGAGDGGGLGGAGAADGGRGARAAGAGRPGGGARGRPLGQHRAPHVQVPRLFLLSIRNDQRVFRKDYYAIL